MSILDDFPEECEALLQAAFLAGAEAKVREIWTAWFWLAAFDLMIEDEEMNRIADERASGPFVRVALDDL